jgi:hypothetical protein
MVCVCTFLRPRPVGAVQPRYQGLTVTLQRLTLFRVQVLAQRTLQLKVRCGFSD